MWHPLARGSEKLKFVGLYLMMARSIQCILIVVVAALALTGCSYIRVAEDPYFDEETYTAKMPHTLAIAPITNHTRRPEIAEMMRRELYKEFSGLHYEDVELEKVDSIISSKATLLGVLPSEVHPSYVAEPDLADAVVFVQVEKVSRLFLLIFSRITIDMRVLMVDTSTRRYLYLNHFIIHNNYITPPTSLIAIVTSLATSLWHLRDQQIEESIEEAAAVVAERFPTRANRVAAGSTYINQVRVSVPRDPLRLEDRVVVSVEGAPGREARFTIGPLLVSIPMVEVNPGSYTASYSVKAGDSGRYLFATVELVNPQAPAEQARYQAIDQPFAVDTIPPPPYEVAGWLIRGEKAGVTLRFSPENRVQPVRDDRPAVYHVYRGSGAGSQLVYLGSNTLPEYEDATALSGVEYEYAVVAEDSAGNRSIPLSRVLVRP